MHADSAFRRRRHEAIMPLTAYLAEVIQQFRYAQPIVMPASNLYISTMLAKKWVEEGVLQGLVQHVPAKCLTGWVRYGDIVRLDGDRRTINPDTVTQILRYQYNGETFVWEEVDTYEQARFPMTRNSEHWRV